MSGRKGAIESKEYEKKERRKGRRNDAKKECRFQGWRGVKKMKEGWKGERE